VTGRGYEMPEKEKGTCKGTVLETY
jgi:hypothetical protein